MKKINALGIILTGRKFTNRQTVENGKMKIWIADIIILSIILQAIQKMVLFKLNVKDTPSIVSTGIIANSSGINVYHAPLLKFHLCYVNQWRLIIQS